MTARSLASGRVVLASRQVATQRAAVLRLAPDFFPPTAIGGCALFIEPTVANRVLNGSNLSRVVDASGNGDANRDVVQATPGNQPPWSSSDATFGGYPSISNTTSTWMQSGTWSAPLAQPSTWYAAFSSSTSGTARTVFDGLTVSNRQDLNIGNGGLPNMFAGSTVQVASGVWNRTAMIACCVFNGASSALYLWDFQNPQATGNVGAGTIAGVTVGASYQLSAILGRAVAHVSAWSGAHASSTRQQMFAYMSRFTPK